MANLDETRGLGCETYTPAEMSCVLKLIHLNVQSVINKLDAVEVFSTEHEPLIVCLTETWTNPDSVSLCNIHGYEMASHYSRREHSHGGCAIYVRTGTDCREVREI